MEDTCSEIQYRREFDPPPKKIFLLRRTTTTLQQSMTSDKKRKVGKMLSGKKKINHVCHKKARVMSDEGN